MVGPRGEGIAPCPPLNTPLGPADQAVDLIERSAAARAVLCLAHKVVNCLSEDEENYA